MTGIIFVTIFGIVIAIITDLIVLGNHNSEEITRIRQEKTTTFFMDVNKVITLDITPHNFAAISATTLPTPRDYINTTDKLAILGSGQTSSPAMDAWGVPIEGVMYQETQVLYNGDGGASVVKAPITAIALVSKGSAKTLPQTLSQKIQTAHSMNDVMNLGNYAEPENIVYTFSDYTAQQDNFAHIRETADRMVDLISGLHQQDVTEATLLGQDATTVPMPDLSDENLKKDIGLTPLVEEITRPTSAGGKLAVTFTRSADRLTLTMEVKNDPLRPTPWSINYVKTLKSGG